MGKTIDCHFWNPELGLEDSLEFKYEDVGNNIELKKPVFTVDALDKIINDIKQARQDYLLKIEIPIVLDVIGKVTDLWMDPEYKGRKSALKESEAYYTSLLARLEAEVERLHTVLECSEDVEILKSENAHLLDENANLQEAYDKAQYDATAMREVLRCKND